MPAVDEVRRGEMSRLKAAGRIDISKLNKMRVTTRRADGFRTFKALEVALYHSLGKLPEPPPTHRFCCAGVGGLITARVDRAGLAASQRRMLAA